MLPATTAPRKTLRRVCLALLPAAALLILFARHTAANAPLEPAEQKAVVGQPVKLQIEPAAVTLDGPRSLRQLLVTGQYADGKLRDLTPFCQLKLDSDMIAAVQAGGLLTPKHNGTVTLTIQAGGQSAKVPVTVKNFEAPQPISFRHDVIAALNVAGCNSGACHGTPTGKGGFKLSLRGYLPDEDYLSLTRDVMGRRTNVSHPEASLILLKPLGLVPHGGGVRFSEDSDACKPC